MERSYYPAGRFILIVLETMIYIGWFASAFALFVIYTNQIARPWMVPFIGAVISLPIALLTVFLARAIFDIADCQRTLVSRHSAVTQGAYDPLRPTATPPVTRSVTPAENFGSLGTLPPQHGAAALPLRDSDASTRRNSDPPLSRT